MITTMHRTEWLRLLRLAENNLSSVFDDMLDLDRRTGEQDCKDLSRRVLEASCIIQNLRNDIKLII